MRNCGIAVSPLFPIEKQRSAEGRIKKYTSNKEKTAMRKEERRKSERTER
jgi:hypothetical protein